MKQTNTYEEWVHDGVHFFRNTEGGWYRIHRGEWKRLEGRKADLLDRMRRRVNRDFVPDREEWSSATDDHKPVSEMYPEFEGVKMAFGLHAQGHVETVKAMIEDGKDWAEIGKAIGWDGDSVRSHWLLLQSKNEKGMFISPRRKQACLLMASAANVEHHVARKLVDSILDAARDEVHGRET